MAENSEPPYQWDTSLPPPAPKVLQLWSEVGAGLDKNSTVVWKSAVESLDQAILAFTRAPQAREFCEGYMTSIIGILVEQQPSKIGIHERNCVEESLMLAVRIVAKDIAIQVKRQCPSKLLPTLSHVFDKRKAFYKGMKGASWNANHNHQLVGLPGVRLRALQKFRQESGFQLLNDYLKQRINRKADFPSLSWIHEVLAGLSDSIPVPPSAEDRGIEDDAILLAGTVMGFMRSCSEEELKRLPVEEVKVLLSGLQRLFDRLVVSRRDSTVKFYEFWRLLTLQYISSQSLPLKLFGWEQMGELIRACEAHRPPPRAFDVKSAGLPFMNGEYVFGGHTTSQGYARLGTDVVYHREVPADAQDGAGKKLTLFRCTMRSQQKWWFLSEADEEQPGTDRDIDYYQHKAKEHEEAYPPPTGWWTCRNTGVDPPPTLEAKGLLVPDGQEEATLEHDLAKWAIDNEIVEKVLGDSTIHREVVSRSTVLIKFLASMCDRIATNGSDSTFCLQPKHLLYAWKTCTRKADAAVSLQVYQLLVSILPLCPASLANPLLRAIQASLQEGEEGRDYLFEVSEFCSALANGVAADAKSPSRPELSEDVREEVLNLLWSVLTHPEASSLKSYESLKQYVTCELKVEPKGSQHRERFLRSCVDAMNRHGSTESESVNESVACRMVRLLDFVLRACPIDQAETLVSANESALAWMVFNELTSYLDRRRNYDSSLHLALPDHKEAMQDRLTIVRHVFGLSLTPFNAPALKQLWERCVSPTDREAMIVFVADSTNDDVHSQRGGICEVKIEKAVSAALSEEVCRAVFLDLFCDPSIDFVPPTVRAYASFQVLFKKVIQSTDVAASKTKALDALWRVVLTVNEDSVADQAMKDLLFVYVSQQASLIGETMVTDEVHDNFDERIYTCLAKVRRDIVQPGSSVAVLSAQRCLRVLKAAIGVSVQDPLASASTLQRLASISVDSSLDDAVRCLPHGIRGQASCRRIGIVTKGPHQRPPSSEKFQIDVHPLETLYSLRQKVAIRCQCPPTQVKPVQAMGRSQTGRSPFLSLNEVSEDSVVDEVGLVQGCEVVFVISESVNQRTVTPRDHPNEDLSNLFFAADGKFADKLYMILMEILENLPRSSIRTDGNDATPTHTLVWDLLLAMPSDDRVCHQVNLIRSADGKTPVAAGVAMETDSAERLLDISHFDRSVYALLTIDSFLQPAPEAFSIVHRDWRLSHEEKVSQRAGSFRRAFIDAGGFASVVQFFSLLGSQVRTHGITRRGSAVALRVIKSCLFGNEPEGSTADQAGIRLLQSLADVDGLLQSLIGMVIDDEGISSSTVANVLKFLSLLFHSDRATRSFVGLRGAERFVITLLLWEGGKGSPRTNSAISSAMQIRRQAHDLVLSLPSLADFAFPWLMKAVGGIDTSLDSTDEFFDVLEKLTSNTGTKSRTQVVSEGDLRDLGVTVCKKLAMCPRPQSEFEAAEHSTGVLCGCLKLLRAVIDLSGGKVLREATSGLVSDLNLPERWSSAASESGSRGVFSLVSSSFASRPRNDDATLIDLMGVLFEGFLTPIGSTGVAVCCDRESRRGGFDVLFAAAAACESPDGYMALVTRINNIIESTAPRLRNRWSQFGSSNETRTRGKAASNYSGLRNQGCTCYMNSVLQQIFMMPDLRDSMCSAPLPVSLRSSGHATTALSGDDLVGKKLSIQWDNGVSYDAVVQAFDDSTGMHKLSYLPIPVATAVNGSSGPQQRPDDIPRLPPPLPEEFVLSVGRPGKETGVFEIVKGQGDTDGDAMETSSEENLQTKQIPQAAAVVTGVYRQGVVEDLTNRLRQ